MCSGPSQCLSSLHCFMRSQKEHGEAASGSLAGHRGDGVEIAEGAQPATEQAFPDWGYREAQLEAAGVSTSQPPWCPLRSVTSGKKAMWACEGVPP